MPDKSPPPPQRFPRRNFLLRSEQIACAFFLLLGILSLTAYCLWRGTIRGRLIEIDRAPPLTAQFEVDINQAPWPELAQLPGLGETMARRIVDERVARGAFADHHDLERRVRGIGPRTLDRIRPYLMPMPDVQNVADTPPNRPSGNSTGT